MPPCATQPVFRFAPSPNGLLHLGHAHSALLNFAMARHSGGRFLLRIEDIDPDRCRSEFEAAVYDDLHWLGLDWEVPVRRQSEHFGEYAAALAPLTAQGFTYPCFCSRSQIAAAVFGREDWPLDPDGAPHYPGTCRQLAPKIQHQRLGKGDAAAVRLDVGRALATLPRLLEWTEEGAGRTRSEPARPERWGDVVLARKDVPTSYHLSVVCDDALQGVTHVVRGADLFEATAIHRLLQHLLGLPAPRYCHHALLLDGHGRKLSKSLASRSLASLRDAGVTPDHVREMAGVALARGGFATLYREAMQSTGLT